MMSRSYGRPDNSRTVGATHGRASAWPRPGLKQLCLAPILATFIAVPSPTPADPVGLGPADTQVFSNVILVADAQEAFKTYSESAETYGAFYTTLRGDGWGYHSDMFTLSDAKLVARAYCEYSTGEKCAVYALTRPRTKPAGDAVPDRVLADVDDILSRNEPGHHGAIAVAPMGFYGYSYNYPLVSDAEDRALRECNLSSETNWYDEPKEARAAARAAGLYDCRTFLILSN